MPVQAEEYSVPMDPVLFEWNGRSVNGFRFSHWQRFGKRFSVRGSLQPVFPFDGGMRTVAIGLVAGVSAAAEHYPVPNFEGSAVFALDADPPRTQSPPLAPIAGSSINPRLGSKMNS